ncbi:CmcJ/NvfI family oxidoreductase [Pelagibius marinus]|uniref:CmcJ/NvfI family oxidoreductase n=1 Tax=Pelagibius marinus TaxID=2762760 RepID=UPI001D045EB9|nr:CmcJ/NvfI family oxidoreductase [Pelagibius marinus]
MTGSAPAVLTRETGATPATASTTPSSVPSTAAVTAPLNFIVPQTEKPVLESSALTGGAPRELFATEAREVDILDLRPLAESFSLDREGFVLRPAPTAVDDLYDDRAVEAVYYPEIEALLKHELGASRVAIFDATRRSDAAAGAANRDGARGPAGRVHVDYTAVSGPRRAADVLGEAEVARLTAKGARIVQVNVWRPIRGPVRRAPLALADAASVRPGALVATDQVFPDRVGEIYHLAHEPGQRWFYAPEMTRDEVLLIKGWDSLDDGRARFTPHSAFALPQQRSDTPPRESIEIRTFAVIE